MGCANSGGTKASIGARDQTTVDLESAFDWEKPCQRTVNDFSIYSDRLREIDWRAAIATNEDWKDPYWAHDRSSLLDPNIRQFSRHERWNNFTWKRPQEVYRDGTFVLYEKPGPNDILQGQLGDCYFLASLSAIAEYPNRIKKIFLTHEVNEAGCYAVTMYINGEKRTVVVDDYFPYDNENNTWAFSQPKLT